MILAGPYSFLTTKQGLTKMNIDTLCGEACAAGEAAFQRKMDQFKVEMGRIVQQRGWLVKDNSVNRELARQFANNEDEDQYSNYV